MRFEKVFLSFFAILIGLIVAGIAFYFYQSTKIVSPNSIRTIKLAPTPTPSAMPLPLAIDSPVDESVTSNPTMTISGTTVPNATVMINTATKDQVIPASSTGTFSTTMTLNDNENRIIITAIDSNGNESQKTITVTYSTEDF